MTPTICVDFDGVLHSYTSGWQGIATIPDPPGSWRGRWAMRRWLYRHLMLYWGTHCVHADYLHGMIEFPKKKPAALIYLDDRAWRFEGKFLSAEDIRSFRPWYKAQLVVEEVIDEMVHEAAVESAEAKDDDSLRYFNINDSQSVNRQRLEALRACFEEYQRQRKAKEPQPCFNPRPRARGDRQCCRALNHVT